jgi:hypothetical protein
MVPLTKRPSMVVDELLKLRSTSVQSLELWEDDRRRTETFARHWYCEMYGMQAVDTIGPVGRLPIQLRGGTYFIVIPLIFGKPKLDLRPLVKGAPVRLLDELGEDDWRRVERVTRHGILFLTQVVRCQQARSQYGLVGWELLEIANGDLELATDALMAGRTGESAFLSQQAAEKALKSVLVAHGFTTPMLKKVGHNLASLLKECVVCAPSLGGLQRHLADVDFPMGVRYGEEAVETDACIQAAMSGACILGNAAHVLRTCQPPGNAS